MGPHASAARDTQDVLDGIRRIVQALRESSRRAERVVGLTGAQLFVLQTLAQAPGASVNELAARAHTHQSSVSTVVAALVTRGLVRRARAKDDGRRMELSLSARGRALVERAPDVPQARLIAAVERLTASERRQLAAALGALAQAMDTSPARTPAMFFEERRAAAKAVSRG